VSEAPVSPAASDPNVAPAIYYRSADAQRVGRLDRFLALALAIGCIAILCVAAYLPPSPTGTGTHAQLRGLQTCQFLQRTGLPCPSCGMTTSFSWFVRGNWLASLYIQPMAWALAVLTTVAAWTSLYVATTAKPAHRLLRLVPTRYYLIPLLSLAVAAWGWKMFLILKGIDGWR
jgi:hypothetical protein